MADKDKFGFSDKAYGKALADAAKKGGFRHQQTKRKAISY